MRFLKADKLFDGKSYLPENKVLAIDAGGVLKQIISENELGKNNIEHLHGILCPGFINAHCHLELSHLKNKIPQGTGLQMFARQVVSLRNTIGSEEIISSMRSADNEMLENGIVATGDISNTADSFEQKLNSGVYYHTFVELLGLNPENAQVNFDKGKALLFKLKAMHLPGSLAPHAPYSTSKKLIRLISEYNSSCNLPFSIHNQESMEEKKFLEGTPSDFEELYTFLGLDLSWYKAPGVSGLTYYQEILSEKPSLLVHNTFSSGEDVKLSHEKNIFWCFCPGANKYIEDALPDFSLFKDQKHRICIGTDSLAGNTQLNVVAEANILMQHSNDFSLEDMLRALTYNGAKALGISDSYGGFLPGKNAGLNLVEFKNSKINFVKKIS